MVTTMVLSVNNLTPKPVKDSCVCIVLETDHSNTSTIYFFIWSVTMNDGIKLFVAKKAIEASDVISLW